MNNNNNNEFFVFFEVFFKNNSIKSSVAEMVSAVKTGNRDKLLI